MKRTLSLVLALVMILGTIPAFGAAPTVNEAAEFLNEVEVLIGDNSGNLNLEAGLRRQESVIMLARLLGEDDVALATEGEPTWEDVKDPYWNPVLKWAQDAEWYKGHSNVRFGYDEVITAQDYGLVLLRALGFETAWEEAYEKALELGLFEDIGEKTEITRAQMAVATYVALGTEMADGEKTLADALEIKLPVDEIKITAKAVKANQLEITFNQEVDTEDLTVKVTRGTAAVAGEIKWNAAKTVATFTANANLLTGTHTVTVTSEADEDLKVTAEVDVVARFVNEIRVLNDIALTGDDAKEVYVYYDVFDQYGESVRSTTNIQWTASIPNPTVNRATGEITLKRTGQQFVFGEKIYITGVETRTGLSVQKELTVGQPRALDQLNVVGFAKKGTTTIVDELPAGFKSGTYYMVFEALDQNGNPIPADKVEKKDITFVSDNPLLVKELAHDNGSIDNVRTLVIDGVEYAVVVVEPGMNVDRGGEVNIMAIATRTGKQTLKNVAIGDFVILTSFDMLQPSGVVAEDEDVEIPFTALDQNGNAITNFRVLARNVNLNSLQFNSPNGAQLVLSEQKDGTAELWYVPTTYLNWDSNQSTDGLDRPVAVTSIVTGGNTSNLILSVSDKARPVAIKSVEMDNTVVYQGSTSVLLNANRTGTSKSSFLFVDQYGREMRNDRAHAFLKATQDGLITTTEFNGYEYAVGVTYRGGAAPQFNVNTTANLQRLEGTGTVKSGNNFVMKAGTTKLTLTANVYEPQTALTGMSLRFEIVRSDDNFAEVESVSSARTENLTIVNIKQVRNIEMKEIGKVYLPTSNTGNLTGRHIDGTDMTVNLLENTSVTGVPMGIGLDSEGALQVNPNNLGYVTGHVRALSVTGNYNNDTVTIPSNYIDDATPANSKVIISEDVNGVLRITGYNPTNINWSDLYDVTTAQFTRKDASQEVKATVKDINAPGTPEITTVSRRVSISDEMPKVTVIDGKDEWTVIPLNTKIEDHTNFTGADDGLWGINEYFKHAIGRYTYKDQYNVNITDPALPLTYTILEVVENADGYAENNFKVSSNGTVNAKIEGAERGDTFTVRIAASFGGATVTKDVKVTVGADANANITDGVNHYLRDLIGDGTGTGNNPGLLELQRQQSMQ